MRTFILGIVIFVLPGCVANAQIPQGSILWLRADRGVIIKDGRVATWEDQSGLGHDATTANPGQQPDFLAFASNGKPALIFHGWNSFQTPNIFPTHGDYSVAIVAKINNTININNLVSGNGHAIYLDSTLYPRIVHESFFNQEYGTIAMDSNGASTVLALYSEADQQAQLYVNGEFADSSYVGSTSDSTIAVASFVSSYFLQGEIQEILVYNRELDSSDRTELDTYLRTKYGIVHASPNPKPDSTFTALPAPEQLFARGADDSATVPITGTIYQEGFDSIYLLQFKNGTVLSRSTLFLTYINGTAAFAFLPRIHAELSEYRFEVHLVASGFDSLIALRDSIVCGDIFLLDGQSDAIFGYNTYRPSNEFFRTFGVNFSENLRDTLWSIGGTYRWGNGNAVGAWGQRIQENIVEQEHIPSCCINGAVSATNIELHERNDSDKYSLLTIYGRMLYRATHSGLLGAIHAIFWEQGEANYGVGYYDKFLKLYCAWKQDYPALEKIYLLQNRPNYCYWFNQDMRDAQRYIEDSLLDVETIAKAAMPYYDGCHFEDSGFDALGDRLFLSFARDFYHSADTDNLRSPNPIWAWWTHSDHSQAAILFSPRHAQVHATDDTTADGIFATLKDYLYPNDTDSHVESVEFDGDTLFVDLDHPGNTKSIAYLPDQHYNGNDTAVYEGPWIVNQRGLGALLWYNLAIADNVFSEVAAIPASRDFTIIPDPTARSITLDLSKFPGIAQVRLVTGAGAVVWRKSLPVGHSDKITFDLESESSGRYLLQITNGKISGEQKFILER